MRFRGPQGLRDRYGEGQDAEERAFVRRLDDGAYLIEGGAAVRDLRVRLKEQQR